MKKSEVFIWLFLLCVNLGFSQEIISDKYSGMKMELSAAKNYLSISYIKTGSPADMIPVRSGDRIYMINDKNVMDIPDISNYFENNKNNSIKISVGRAAEETKSYNLPRVAIDLFSKRYVAEGQLYSILTPYQMVGFRSDISSEKEKYDDLESIVQSSENPQAYSIVDPNYFTRWCYYSLKLNVSKSRQITTLADPEKGIAKFRTYDFEYTSESDPLMEKTLLNDLGKQLNQFGLKREAANPDILILISFYSGQTDQFIPPQQIVSTKIKDYFNWYWGYIPVPITESKTKAGYTKSNFLTNINIKFFDAKEITTSKTPPLIWSSSYSEVAPVKTFLSDCSKEIFEYLLLQFPVVIKENCNNLTVNTYTYTGVIYDKDNLAIVADVIPGSPAFLSGVRSGDEILRINERKNEEKITNDDLSFQWRTRSDFFNAFRYIFINSNFNNGNPTLFQSLQSDFDGYKNSSDKPIVFEIRRDKKKMTISVNPEFKKVIFFEDEGFTI